MCVRLGTRGPLVIRAVKKSRKTLSTRSFSRDRSTSAVLPPIPDVPLHAPTADPYLTNQAFFESLSLDSHELHQVHGSSITWPLGAVDAIDTTFGRILQHVLTDLDKDAPVAALLPPPPRILCFPPPPGLDRSKLTIRVHQPRAPP